MNAMNTPDEKFPDTSEFDTRINALLQAVHDEFFASLVNFIEKNCKLMKEQGHDPEEIRETREKALGRLREGSERVHRILCDDATPDDIFR